MLITLQVAQKHMEGPDHPGVLLKVTSGPPDEHGWQVAPDQYIELVSDHPGAHSSFASGGCVLVPIET